ncbi:MAG: PEP/pyruvate-binding domain-containing protein [archaeon]
MIKQLANLTGKDIPSAGEKGVQLGALIKAGLAVPPGFVVSSEAFKEFLDVADIKPDMEDLLKEMNPNDGTDLKVVSKTIRTMITGAKLPEHTADEIKIAYEELSKSSTAIKGVEAKRGEFVAVRTSSKPGDLKSRKALLNVTGADELISAVKACWASAFEPQELTYRKEQGIAQNSVLPAVVVQKMVDSEKAGTIFTAHPVTGHRNMLTINAVWGIGEAATSGEIAPDHYVVDKETLGVVSRLIENKAFMYTRDIKSGKTKRVMLKQDISAKEVLTEEDYAQLLALAQKFGEKFSEPHQIEWAIEDDDVFVIGAKPFTPPPEMPLEEIEDEEGAQDLVQEEVMGELEHQIETEVLDKQEQIMETMEQETELEPLPTPPMPHEFENDGSARAQEQIKERAEELAKEVVQAPISELEHESAPSAEPELTTDIQEPIITEEEPTAGEEEAMGGDEAFDLQKETLLELENERQQLAEVEQELHIEPAGEDEVRVPLPEEQEKKRLLEEAEQEEELEEIEKEEGIEQV